MFNNLVNLQELYLGNYSVYLREDERIKEKISQGFYNRFSGSLQPLQNLSKLEKLDIRNTDVDNGLEYLSDNVKNFCCSADERKIARCKALENILKPYKHDIQKWRETEPAKLLIASTKLEPIQTSFQQFFTQWNDFLSQQKQLSRTQKWIDYCKYPKYGGIIITTAGGKIKNSNLVE